MRHLRIPLPVVGSAAAGVLLVALAVSLPGDGVSTFLLRLVELLVAGGAAYVLDDRAAEVTVVAPRGPWRRRAPALAGAVGLLAVSWAAILVILRWQDPVLSLAALTGEVVVIGALAVAVASVLVRRGEPEPGSQVSAAVAVGGLGVLVAEPLIRAPIFFPVGGPRGTLLVAAWIAAGVVALVVTLAAGRDPASRWRD